MATAKSKPARAPLTGMAGRTAHAAADAAASKAGAWHARPGRRSRARISPAPTMPYRPPGSTLVVGPGKPSLPTRRGVRADATASETGVGRNIVETIVGRAGPGGGRRPRLLRLRQVGPRAGPSGYESHRPLRPHRRAGARGADVTVSGVKVGTVTGFDSRPQDLPGGGAHDGVVVRRPAGSTPTPRS